MIVRSNSSLSLRIGGGLGLRPDVWSSAGGWGGRAILVGPAALSFLGLDEFLEFGGFLARDQAGFFEELPDQLGGLEAARWPAVGPLLDTVENYFAARLAVIPAVDVDLAALDVLALGLLRTAVGLGPERRRVRRRDHPGICRFRILIIGDNLVGHAVEGNHAHGSLGLGDGDPTVADGSGDRADGGDLLVGTSTPLERGEVPGLFGRGSVLRISPDGRTRVVGEGLRYNFGWGRNGQGSTYFTCNQGPWYVTCTICLQRDGAHHGYGQPDRAQVDEPVLFVPYPWCRSLTGLTFADGEVPFGAFQGQGLAADYNTRRIIRWTDQPVGDGRQGACYPFLDGLDAGPTQMIFGPDGALYVGFMSDGSWYPERARGGIFRIVPEGPTGVSVLRAESTPTGFVVEFTEPVDPASIGPGTCDRVHRYFHEYEGRYHSEEIAHEDVPVQELVLSPDGRRLTLTTGPHVTPRIVALQLRGVRAVTGEALEVGEVYLTVHTQPDR